MENNILEERFNELRDEGYIYDVDENGMNMSYGESIAVAEDLEETLERGYEGMPFPEAIEFIKKQLDCSDDVTIFYDAEPYREFIDYLEEVEINGEEYYRLYKTPENPPEKLMEIYRDYEETIPEPEEEVEIW